MPETVNFSTGISSTQEEDECVYHRVNKTVIVEPDPFQVLQSLVFGDTLVCLNDSRTNISTELIETVKAKSPLLDNASFCIPFSHKLLTCTKWRLDWKEYTLHKDGTLLYVTPTHTETYPLGFYKISGGNNASHVCIPSENLPSNESMDFAIFCLWVLSLFSLFLLLVACPLFRSCRSSAFWPLMFHAMSLFIRYGMIILFQVQHEPERRFCIVIALTAHMSFISANTWLNVMNFDMWRQFRKQGFTGNEPYTFKKLFLQGSYAWGVPSLIVGVALLLGNGCFPLVSGYKERCLFAVYDNEVQIVFFFGAIGVCVLVNIVLVALTFYTLCRQIEVLAQVNQQIRKQIISTNFKLLILSGFTWLLIIVVRVSVSYDLPSIISTVIEVIMSLQGIFLLAIYASASSTRSKVKHFLACN